MFWLIFGIQHSNYAVELQIDNKGRMKETRLSSRTSYLTAYQNCLFFCHFALIFCHALLLQKHLGKNKNEKLDLHLCDLVITLIVIGIIAELQAREARAWSEHHSLVNLPIPENLVITWPYTNRPTAQLSSAPQEHQCLLSHFPTTLIVIGIMLLFWLFLKLQTIDFDY